MTKKTANRKISAGWVHAILFTIVLAFSVPSHAQALNPILQSAKVKHLNTVRNQLLFQVQLHNQNAERFSLLIKDEQGTVLFHKYFQDRNFEQRFLLVGIGEENKLIFVIRTLKDHQSQAFEINRNTRVVEDYVVTRL